MFQGTISASYLVDHHAVDVFRPITFFGSGVIESQVVCAIRQATYNA